MFFVLFLMSGAPEGSTDSGSGLYVPETVPQLKFSSDRLVEPGFELGTPGYMVSDLSFTPRVTSTAETLRRLQQLHVITIIWP